jgi:hypothetical protein
MVGVWMEPVIAQLMIILLAIDVSFPLGTIRKQRTWEMHRRCQSGVISRLFRAGHYYRALARPSLRRSAGGDIVEEWKTAEFRRQNGHNCTLKPKFRPLETACISTGLHPSLARFRAQPDGTPLAGHT